MFRKSLVLAVVGLALSGSVYTTAAQQIIIQIPGQQPTYQEPPRHYHQHQQQRTTTVTVTNRGQNGYPDQVVQQVVQCGSQYFDGYQQRIARC